MKALLYCVAEETKSVLREWKWSTWYEKKWIEWVELERFPGMWNIVELG